ncbi:flagellar motor protein MotB [Priestia endophytica]|uniref:OmpA family protein n=1 Tax=Priestia endophytica TaxID=135735 RepID=UPI003D2D2CE5
MKSRKRRLRRPKRGEDGGNVKWLVTFADLITLILVFFVLLFSMSHINSGKFQKLVGSMDKTLASEKTKDVHSQESQGEAQSKMNSDDLLAYIKGKLKKNNLDDKIAANKDSRGVVLVLQEQILFPTGEASLVPESRPFLNKIGEIIKELPNVIRVEGHTDKRPIRNSYYPSNWELSTARASSVIQYLSETYNINSGRFVAIGYGDTKPLKISNQEEEMKKNRRVEIVISDLND